MKIADTYSFKGGQELMETEFAFELQEIKNAIAAVDSTKHKTEGSKENTIPNRPLYKPHSLKEALKKEFGKQGWANHKILCEYPTEFYVSDYKTSQTFGEAFRDIDFVKNRIGVEIQFGQYAFMVYNVCAKMTIFHNQDVIDVGVEVVPLKELAKEMSTGVSYFEQFMWGLKHRGVADIDIPVLILGITV